MTALVLSCQKTTSKSKIYSLNEKATTLQWKWVNAPKLLFKLYII